MYLTKVIHISRSRSLVGHVGYCDANQTRHVVVWISAQQVETVVSTHAIFFFFFFFGGGGIIYINCLRGLFPQFTNWNLVYNNKSR